MTMRETWLRFVSACCRPEPGPSLDERIDVSIKAHFFPLLEGTNKVGQEFNRRLNNLEKRNDQVDAFYVKTVTQALSERQDALVNKVWNQWADDSKAMSLRVEGVIYRIDDLVAELQKERAKTDAVNLRLDALVSKLRAGLE